MQTSVHTFEMMEGSPGLRLDEVAHVFLPGRGRNGTGDGLSRSGEKRAHYAADFFIDQDLEAKGGVIVASGYKTPADKAGEPWSHPDSGEVFQGIPEAYLYYELLRGRSIGAAAIRTELHSIDTATNFVCSEAEGHFPDGPVAIVGQKKHLERMLKIASRTLKREYIGVVVPEKGEGEPDSICAKFASRAVLLGINPDTPRSIEKTASRARRIWAVVNGAQAVAQLVSPS